jgi:hypothetical protein
VADEEIIKKWESLKAESTGALELADLASSSGASKDELKKCLVRCSELQMAVIDFYDKHLDVIRTHEVEND